MRMSPFGCSSLDNSSWLYDIEQRMQVLGGAKEVIFDTLFHAGLKVSVDTFPAQQFPTPSNMHIGYLNQHAFLGTRPTTHTNKSWPIVVFTRCESHNRKSASRHARTLCTTRACTAMTTSLVSFHIAPHTKCFSATFVGTLKWLLPRMRMTVDAKTRWPGESLVARGADVSVLGLASKVRR